MRKKGGQDSDIGILTEEPQTREYVELDPLPPEVKQGVKQKNETSSLTTETKTAPTAEELKAQIAELQNKLALIGDETNIDKEFIEIPENEQEAQMLFEARFLELQNKLRDIKRTLNTKHPLDKLRRQENRSKKESARAKKIIEKSGIIDFVHHLLVDVIPNQFREKKINTELLSKFRIDKKGNVLVSTWSIGMSRVPTPDVSYRERDNQYGKLMSESLIKSYLRLLYSCRLISERFRYKDYPLDEVKTQIDEILKQMSDYENDVWSVTIE